LGVALLSWLLLHNLGKMLGFRDGTDGLECLRRFGLDYAWQESVTSAEQERDVFLATLLMQTAARTSHPATSEVAFAELCNDPVNTRLLGINSHANETWFLQEGMTALAGAIALQAEITDLMNRGKAESAKAAPAIAEVTDLMNGGKAEGAKAAPAIAEILRQRLARAAAVGYRLDKFLSLG
jgi:hypothetical protein